MARSSAIALGFGFSVLLAGCASPREQPAGSSTPVPTPSTSSSTSSAASVTSPATPSRPTVQVSGVLEEGIEHGCLLLRPSDGSELLLLLGDLAGIGADQTVTVRGHRQPDLLSTCQQGVPFVVTEVL